MRFHGGKWRNVRIDFSVNTNPLAPQELIHKLINEAINRKVYLRYPNYEYDELRKAIANFFGGRTYSIVPVNGAAEALVLTVLALRPKYLILTCPSFGDYEEMCGLLRVALRYVPYKVVDDEYVLDIESITRYCRDDSLIVINNPNNPTGSLVPRGEIFELLGWRRCYVLLDEAYVELCRECDFKLPKNLPTNVILVRSFTKWLALPGIRAGFIYVSSNELRDLFDGIRQPWNVNSIAEFVITELLTRYSDYLKNLISMSREYISNERKWLSNELSKLGLKVFRSRTNFVLVKSEGVNFNLINELLINKYGVAIRPCIGFRGLSRSYARISIRCRSENKLLVSALSEALKMVSASA